MGSSLLYYFFYGLAVVLSLIPYRVGQFFGKKSALLNISQSFNGVLAEGEAERLLRRVFLHFGRIFFEIPYMMREKGDSIS